MGQDLHHSLCQQPSSWAPVDIAHIRAEAPDLAKAKYTAQATKRQEQGEGKSLCPTPFPPPATVHLSQEWKRTQDFHSHHRHYQCAKPGLPRCCLDNFDPHCIRSLPEKDRHATAHGNESCEATCEARVRQALGTLQGI